MKTERYLTIVALLLTNSLSVFAATNNDKIPGATVQDAAFFTGKPYDADLESYVFNYRNYNAEAGRWTTADPSGFPDGANNTIYMPIPTSEIDALGLERRRIREPNFWRGWSLDTFDERGKELLGHWLDGTHSDFVREGGTWGTYMDDNELLTRQINAKLQEDFSGRSSSGDIDITFHAEIENGYLTGYEMLHGTNSDKGDFNIKGSATYSTAGGRKVVKYDVTNSWNDIIDPNHSYSSDTFLSGVLNLFYSPADFDAHISWDKLRTFE